MFSQLEQIHSRPKPFEVYTAADLWTDEHTSKKMLAHHLDESTDLASRNKEFITRSLNWIVTYFRIRQGTSIADFGCGPGLYSTAFAEAGADVIGIDFSSRSIHYAEQIAGQKGLQIAYYQENYLDFVTEQLFDLITLIYCDYCALSAPQRKVLLGKFHTFLKPGGCVLLDVHSINAFDRVAEAASCERNQFDHFWSPDPYYGFLNTFKYDPEKITLDKYTIIDEQGTRVIYNWLQYFSPDSLQAEFEEFGFEVVELFSDVAGSVFDPESPDMAIVARKRENP